MHARTVELMGLPFAALTADAVLDALFASVARGEGGLLLTANLDILRRHVRDPRARALYAQATLVVADGMPIVWASRVRGQALPERVAGASLVPRIAARAASEGRSLFLLGGDAVDAEDAAALLAGRHAGLAPIRTLNPRVSAYPAEVEVAPIACALMEAQPDIVLVAMGSPKQEALALALRPYLPKAYFVGVGASLAFLTGRIPRAPIAMQRLGLEWAHRLGTEPTRLARRYLAEGLPFAAELMAHAARERARSR